MDYYLVKKFFKDTCTEEEAGQVLEWLSTPEGQKYLEERLQENEELLANKKIRPLVSRAETEEIWAGIENKMDDEDPIEHRSSQKTIYFWRLAAGFLLILASFLSYNWFVQSSNTNTTTEAEQLYYRVGDNEQKMLRLSDGTKIRLNSNSEVRISKNFGQNNREVTLKGEAFFEVVHNEQKPFIIRTSEANVKDLGTAFNVRALPGESDVQVAVTEGKVSLWSNKQNEKEATELNPGQFGFLDLKDSSVKVDEFGITNYLSWMNGRIEFKNAPLSKVCIQLSRIYGVSFEYSARSMKDLVLSSTFERGTLDKALEIIAMTLDLQYQKEGNKVQWKAKSS